MDATVSSVVNLEDFDSTLYFLEESEVEYLREEVRKEYTYDMRRNVVAMLLDTYEVQGDRGVREEIGSAPRHADAAHPVVRRVQDGGLPPARDESVGRARARASRRSSAISS